jgi:hypothetical protein
VLRLGGERGMARQEKLFLTKNTLPVFERLLDRLDALPGEQHGRSASPFFYAGLATRYEDERLTGDDRDNLPERIGSLRSGKFGAWRSEREWIPIMLETATAPRRLLLKLDVDDGNIGRLENASCEEIFLAREKEYRNSYIGIPGLDELCDRYGDLANRRAYTMSRDVEVRWLDTSASSVPESICYGSRPTIPRCGISAKTTIASLRPGPISPQSSIASSRAMALLSASISARRRRSSGMACPFRGYGILPRIRSSRKPCLPAASIAIYIEE